MQSLFEQHRHAEHPFFCKLRILCHLLQRHVAVHDDVLLGFGQHGRADKIHLALFHALNGGVALVGRELKRHRRELDVVKMNDVDKLVQIKALELTEEVSHRIGFCGDSVGAEPLHDGVADGAR